jgi:hypothetical protein
MAAGGFNPFGVYVGNAGNVARELSLSAANPVASLGSCCPSQFYKNVSYKGYQGVNVSNRFAWAVTEPVPEGYFRWVIAASGATTDNNGQPTSLHIIPPGFGPTTKTNADDPFFLNPTNAGPTQASVRVDQGPNPSQSGSVTQRFQNRSLLPPSGFLIVPEKWSLMVWEEGFTVPSSSLHTVVLRIAYLDIPFGEDVPLIG